MAGEVGARADLQAALVVSCRTQLCLLSRVLQDTITNLLA